MYVVHAIKGQCHEIVNILFSKLYNYIQANGFPTFLCSHSIANVVSHDKIASYCRLVRSRSRATNKSPLEAKRKL